MAGLAAGGSPPPGARVAGSGPAAAAVAGPPRSLPLAAPVAAAEVASPSAVPMRARRSRRGPHGQRGKGKGKSRSPSPTDPTGKKPICSFYKQGTCRFGSSCAFRHEGPVNAVPAHPEAKAKAAASGPVELAKACTTWVANPTEKMLKPCLMKAMSLAARASANPSWLASQQGQDRDDADFHLCGRAC